MQNRSARHSGVRRLAGSLITDEKPKSPAQGPVIPLPPAAVLPVVSSPPKTTAEWARTYCPAHGQRLPCSRCLEYKVFEIRSELTKKRNDDVNAIHGLLGKTWRDIAESAGIRPEQKCVHGVYLFEFYCGICQLTVVDPNYAIDVYRTEIRKALSATKARVRLGDDFKDAVAIIDIEIWKAVKKYGNEMNAKLAYTIAENQARGLVVDRIEEQTIPVVDRDGNTSLRQRFISLDDKKQIEDGEDLETSKAEIEIHHKELRSGDGQDWLQVFIDGGGRVALEQLARSWHGKQQQVALAMLQPGFTVRSVAGVSKSEVSRIRQTVLKAFNALIANKIRNN